VQHAQNVYHLVADLIHHDVVWMHDVFTCASHATKPEQIRHMRKVFGRLDNGSVKALRRNRVALLNEIDDFHQVGGRFVRPPNGLHGLFGVLLAWPEP